MENPNEKFKRVNSLPSTVYWSSIVEEAKASAEILQQYTQNGEFSLSDAERINDLSANQALAVWQYVDKLMRRDSHNILKMVYPRPCDIPPILIELSATYFLIIEMGLGELQDSIDCSPKDIVAVLSYIRSQLTPDATLLQTVAAAEKVQERAKLALHRVLTDELLESKIMEHINANQSPAASA